MAAIVLRLDRLGAVGIAVIDDRRHMHRVRAIRSRVIHTEFQRAGQRLGVDDGGLFG